MKVPPLETIISCFLPYITVIKYFYRTCNLLWGQQSGSIKQQIGDRAQVTN